MVIEYPLRTYAYDDIFTAAESDVMSYRQGPTEPAAEYASNLERKSFRCGNVLFPERVISIFSEDMQDHLSHDMSVYRSEHSRAEMYTLDHQKQFLDSLVPFLPLKLLRS